MMKLFLLATGEVLPNQIKSLGIPKQKGPEPKWQL